jgi:hypothetical protein
VASSQLPILSSTPSTTPPITPCRAIARQPVTDHHCSYMGSVLPRISFPRFRKGTCGVTAQRQKLHDSDSDSWLLARSPQSHHVRSYGLPAERFDGREGQCSLYVGSMAFDVLVANVGSQSNRPTAASDLPMSLHGLKRKRQLYVASWTE